MLAGAVAELIVWENRIAFEFPRRFAHSGRRRQRSITMSSSRSIAVRQCIDRIAPIAERYRRKHGLAGGADPVRHDRAVARSRKSEAKA